jgi:hypothetical protein
MPLRQGWEVRFVRHGLAWRKLHMRHGKIFSDEGLVDLEHVISTLGRD